MPPNGTCHLRVVAENRAACMYCGQIIYTAGGRLPWVSCPAAGSGAGTVVSKILAAVGLSKARYFRIKRWLFPQSRRGCGCASREIKMNQWSTMLTRLFRRLFR